MSQLITTQSLESATVDLCYAGFAFDLRAYDSCSEEVFKLLRRAAHAQVIFSSAYLPPAEMGTVNFTATCLAPEISSALR